jgi:hypothetical protein
MARRTEEFVGCIHGIDRAEGVVLDVWVYRKGHSVRLSGPIEHSVHPSNATDSNGWKREAGIVWHLTDMIFTPRLLLESPETKKTLESLKQKAAELGKQQHEPSKPR